MKQTIKRPRTLLLVEDDESQIELTRLALRRTHIHYNLCIVRDGQEALDFLKREAAFADAPRPDVVWLDLHLPKKNGEDVLKEMKTDPDLRRIPVVIISTSDDKKEIHRIYGLFANCYAVKPVQYEKFEELIHALCRHWLEAVEVPSL